MNRRSNRRSNKSTGGNRPVKSGLARLMQVQQMQQIAQLTLFFAAAMFLQSCNDDTQFNRSNNVAQQGDVAVTPTPQQPVSTDTRVPSPQAPVSRTPDEIKNKCEGGDVRTIRRRLSYPQTRNACDYGRNGNLSPRQGLIRARRVETISVDLPNNAALCQLRIDSVSRDLRYDDFMFFNVNDIVLVGSSGELMRRMPEERRDIFRFDFNRILNQRADFDDLRRNYCLGGAGECRIPGHDTSGPMTIDFVSDQIFNLSSELSDASRLDFSLVTTGDDDNDCFHTDFILDLEARYTVF